MIRKGALLLALASCEAVSVRSDVLCEAEAERERARESFAACVGQGQPRTLHLDDDTVDLAEWVRSCGAQAREISCREVRTAFRRSTGSYRASATARCDRKPLPAWATDPCGGQP